MDNTKYNNRIADLATDDRPREKALEQGVKKLTTSELIAIVLGSGLPGKSVIDLSREILRSLGDRPERLASMTVKELCRKFKGVGPAKAVGLLAAVELGGRCVSPARSEAYRITDAESVWQYMRHDMAHLDHEEFAMLILSRANRVKAVETISSGGTAGTVVDLKLLLKRAIDALAEGIVVAHNHPSGTLSPSTQDDALTRRIAEGCRAIDIRLLDHVIITPEGFYSYANEGRL